jgi:hypothetical protein
MITSASAVPVVNSDSRRSMVRISCNPVYTVVPSVGRSRKAPVSVDSPLMCTASCLEEYNSGLSAERSDFRRAWLGQKRHGI